MGEGVGAGAGEGQQPPQWLHRPSLEPRAAAQPEVVLVVIVVRGRHAFEEKEVLYSHS